MPDRPEIMMAYGAALSLETMFSLPESSVCVKRVIDHLQSGHLREMIQENTVGKPFFDSREECEQFREEHRLCSCTFQQPQPGQVVHAWLGIDSGVTLNFGTVLPAAFILAFASNMRYTWLEMKGDYSQ